MLYNVIREAADKAADEKAWEEDIQDELDEIRLEAEVDFQQRQAEHKSKLEEWKKQKQLKVRNKSNLLFVWV